MNKSDEEVCLSVNSDEDVEDRDQQTSERRSPSPILLRNGPEKRLRPDSDENGNEDEEDEFITVKRNAKRLNRSLSKNKENENSLEKEKQFFAEENYEICMTSKEILPKQMGLAKLLRKENIGGITAIKYKNPYRVILQFNNEEEAKKLCTRMNELGYRCQSTQQISMSHGVVKNIDLDVEEEELVKEFSSEYEILSVKRMKRFTEEKWINSETVRVCFKGPTLPPYVYSYGCRFKVEPYVFPVSQCSGCWKYGHLIRQCPTKKIICPKCGGQHINCEASEYYCINCKGDHMSLSKNCPLFLKEKQIRLLMSQENCTYKKALNIYLQKYDINDRTVEINSNSINNTPNSIVETIINEQLNNEPARNEPTYKEILLTNNKGKEDWLKRKKHEVNNTSQSLKAIGRNNNIKHNEKPSEPQMQADEESNIVVEENQNIIIENEEKKKKEKYLKIKV